MKLTKVLLAVVVTFISLNVTAQKQMVNTEKSTIEWVGKKIGGQHVGNIQLQEGSITLKKDKITAGNFVIDVNSLTNTDLTDASYNQKLVGHLKSDDFFGVKNFPTATLKILKSTSFSNGVATVQAELTIKGKTENISFEINQKGEAYAATIAVDRSKFDVRYGSNSFFDNLGDKAIDDIFTLNINIFLK